MYYDHELRKLVNGNYMIKIKLSLKTDLISYNQTIEFLNLFLCTNRKLVRILLKSVTDNSVFSSAQICLIIFNIMHHILHSVMSILSF